MRLNPVLNSTLSELDSASELEQAAILARDIVSTCSRRHNVSVKKTFLMTYHKMKVDIKNLKLPRFTPFQNLDK